jgi:hypothetical protein
MILPHILPTLYHGTIESSYLNIKAHGFRCSDKNYSNFLAASGVYFFINRPLLAIRRGERFTDSVLLTSSLLEIPTENVLDLTTDEGMNILWTTYDELNKKRNDVKRWKEELKTDCDEVRKIYLLSKIEKEKNIFENHFLPAEKWVDGNKKNFNMDSLVLDHLSRQFIVIISIVSEGVTMQKKFTAFESKYETVEGYNGIRTRNHLEICVTNTNFIDKTSIREVNIDKNSFHSNFYSHVTSEDRYN